MGNQVSDGNTESMNSNIRMIRIELQGLRNKEQFGQGMQLNYAKPVMRY